jgi:hypothetical protein
MPPFGNKSVPPRLRPRTVLATACIAALTAGVFTVSPTATPPALATTCPEDMSAVPGLSNVCEQRFTDPTKLHYFTVPSGANLVEVLATGGGGGGGGGAEIGDKGGGGGGGGGGISLFRPTVAVGARYEISVPNGGSGGVSGRPGSPGSDARVEFGPGSGLDVRSVPGGDGGLSGGFGGGAGGPAGERFGSPGLPGGGGSAPGGGGGGGGNSSPPNATDKNGGSPGAMGSVTIGVLFTATAPSPLLGGGGGGGGGIEGGLGADGPLPGAPEAGKGGNNGLPGFAAQVNTAGGGGGGGAVAGRGGNGAAGIVIVRVRFNAPGPDPGPTTPPSPGSPQAGPPPPTQAELAEQLMTQAIIDRFLAQCGTALARSAVCAGGSTTAPTVQEAPKPRGDEFPLQFTMTGTTPDGARWESNVIAQPISAEEWGYFTTIGGISLTALQEQGFTFDRPTTFTNKQLLTSVFGYVPQSRYETALLINQSYLDNTTRSGLTKTNLQPGQALVTGAGRIDSDGTARVALDIPADAPSGLYTLRVTGVLPGPELITLSWPVQVLQFGTPVVKETSTTVGFPGNKTTLSARGKTKTATFAATVPQGAAVLETRVVGYPANGKRKQAKARASDVAAALRSDGITPQTERVRGNGDVSKWPDRVGKVYVTLRYVTQS